MRQIFVPFSEKPNFIESVILVLRRLQEWREQKDRQLQTREWQEQNAHSPSGADVGISKVSKRYSPFNHWQDGQLGNMENQEQVHQRILEGKDWPIKKMTNFEFGHFTTIFGHFFANYIYIFHKTEVLMVILRG